MEVPKKLKDEIWEYCRLNDISNIDEFIINMIRQGYSVEKFGATPLGTTEVKEVEKIVEVIREVPVEKIIEKEVFITDDIQITELTNKLSQLEEEKRIFSTKTTEIDTIREEFSTKTVEMENIFHDNNNSQQLQNTIQSLMKNLRDKNIEIDELNKKLTEQQKNNEMNERAKYLRSSNLDDTLYK